MYDFKLEVNTVCQWDVYNNVFSLNYLDYKSKHFFFFVKKLDTSKTVVMVLPWEILNIKFRDKLLPVVCVFSIVSSSC